MAKIQNMLVFSRMVEKNLDIRFAVLPQNLVSVNKVTAGGHVTIGVDQNSANIIMATGLGERSHGSFLCIFNQKQFDETQKELELMQETGKSQSPFYDLEFDLLTRKQFDQNAPGARMHPTPEEKSGITESYPGEFAGRLPGEPRSMWPKNCADCSQELKGIIGCPTCPNNKE